MDLRALSDRIEIEDLLTRYATAVDTRDWELYRSVFTADAWIDYRSAGGPVGNLDETVAFLDKALGHFEMTQHLISNIDCHIDGDSAKVSAVFNNPMRLPGGTVWFIGGQYHHEMVRTDRGWQSHRLVEETLWFDRSPVGDLSTGPISKSSDRSLPPA